MTCPHHQSDAAYVLGALSPAERAEYELHLAQCPQCAAAVARLAPIPGLLRRVDPAALHPAERGPARLTTLLQTVTAMRRRQSWVRRWQVAVAALATAVFAVAGTAVWYGVAGGPSQPPPAVAMEPVSPVVPVAAEVALTPAAGGTQVWISCWYPPTAYQIPPRTFRLIAVGADGSVEQVGSWRAGPGERVSMNGLTRFTTDLVRLELHDEAGGTLLTHDAR